MKITDKTKKGHKTRTYAFTNMTEFMSYVTGDKTPRWRFQQKSKDLGRKENGAYWNGTKTWEKAVALSDTGWDKGLKKVKTAYLAIPESTREVIPRIKATVSMAGQMPLVPLYCAGAPAHMQRFERHNVAAPILRLVIPIGITAGVNPQTFTERGAAVAAFVEALENSGVSVEIVIARATRVEWAGLELQGTVTIKQAGETLNMDRLSFAITNPAIHRRFFFRVTESVKGADWKNAFSGGYGSSNYDLAPIEDGDFVVPTLQEIANGRLAKDFFEDMAAQYARHVE